MFWRSYRRKYGSLFFGRRLEQSFGNWMAHYTLFKVKQGTDVDPFTFMPHEDAPPTSFEEERMKAIKKKSA